MKKPIQSLKKFVKKTFHRDKSSTPSPNPSSADPNPLALSRVLPSVSGSPASSSARSHLSAPHASSRSAPAEPVVPQVPSSTGRQRVAAARVPEFIGPPGPANNLPGEILFAIFLACAPSKYLSHHEIIRGGYSPWPISQVCRSWRAFSLATPELWSTIIYNTGNVKSIESTKARAELILERSRTLPLTVKLYCTRQGASWIPRPHPILEVLMKAADRWERLDLAMTLTMLYELAPLRWRLSRLHHLSIGIIPSDYTPSGMCPVFDSVPSLFSLDLAGAPLFSVVTNGEEVLSRTDLPFWTLTTFRGRYSATTLTFLAQCMNVTTCKLESPLTRRRPGDIFPIAHLPVLRNLELCSSYEWDSGPLPIYTSNAIHLAITLQTETWDAVATRVACSLSGSALHISSLSIRLLSEVVGEARDRAASLLGLIRAAPDARRLEISTKRGIMYNFLEVLIPDSIGRTATRYDILSLDELVLKGVYDPRLCIKLLTARFCKADANRLFGSESDTAHSLRVQMVMTGRNAHRLASAEKAKIDVLRRNGVHVILDPKPDIFH
ncbi:hypothetical protein LshimejAT787_0211730 [Lyophyllum shimeji]|uniref:F-box domain-containing protein n=1 Tax=Lyophyllum shimeji TaxID=47721 RepID=A0A9P3PGP2_LYOSH|nr:hypothetical protein LshimejAT787_0211730 [Lyophyllum shimeji]